MSHVSSRHWREAPGKATLKRSSPVGSAPDSPACSFSSAPYASAQKPVFSECVVLLAAWHTLCPWPGMPPPSCPRGTRPSGASSETFS